MEYRVRRSDHQGQWVEEPSHSLVRRERRDLPRIRFRLRSASSSEL